MAQPYYAVGVGHRPGIYRSWPMCKQQVHKYGGNKYRRFEDYSDARSWMSQFCRYDDSDDDDDSEYGYDEDREYDEPRDDDCQSEYFTRDNEHAPIIFTDGSCLNNGRDGARAGYGVFWGLDHPNNVVAPFRDTPSNNRAEFMAVIVAVEQAINESYRSVHIFTDSQNVVKTMREWMPTWKQNGWRRNDGKRIRNLDLIHQLDDLDEQIEITFRHAYGHQNSRNQLALGNKMADLMANAGAEMF